MLVSILTALQVVLCFVLVGLVLLQHGKGADAGAGFGAGASGSVFGAGGSATFLSRTTAVLAALFFLNCIGLSYLIERQVHRAPTALLRTPSSATRRAPAHPAPVPASKRGTVPVPVPRTSSIPSAPKTPQGAPKTPHGGAR